MSTFLFAWGNAPFTVAAGIVIVFAILQLTGILGLIAGADHGGEHDLDPEVDHDVDQDVDQDVAADHALAHGADASDHACADHGDHADHAGHDDHGHAATAHAMDRSLGAVALAPLGLGKIPFSVIWQTFALSFASVGLALNLLFVGVHAAPAAASLAWTLPLSLAGGYSTVAAVARVLGPILSSTAQEATRRADLVGQIGVVISSGVDERFGEVRIRDRTGHDLRVVCRLHRGSRPAREHESVVVVDYEPEGGELFVEPLDADADRSSPGQP